MLKKIILVMLLIIFGFFVYFGYPIIKNRYFKSEDTAKEGNETIINNPEMNSESKESVSNNIDDEEENSALGDEIESGVDESGNTSNITADDCDNECSDFKNNESDLRYCQDICDLSSTKDSENCDSKVGTDKDYCFKNQAISKTDLEICNSISDTKIKDSCKNRVTEDLLEQQ